MSFKSKKLSILLVGTSLFLCTSLVAAPVFQNIKGYLNTAISYTLDGKSILKDTTTINYEGRNYVAVADLAKALGLEVSYQNNTVTFTTPKEEVAPLPQAPESVTIAKATIQEVNLESSQVTILPEGRENTFTNYIVLNVSEETVIQAEKNRRFYQINDLETGMSVSVTHSSMMTRSMPPQTPALSITLLESETSTEVVPDAELQNVILENRVVTEVHPSKNYFVVVPKGKDATDINHQEIIRYSNTTKLNYLNSNKKPNVNSLKVGQELTLTVGPAATLSLPPQMIALEITVLN